MSTNRAALSIVVILCLIVCTCLIALAWRNGVQQRELQLVLFVAVLLPGLAWLALRRAARERSRVEQYERRLVESPIKAPADPARATAHRRARVLRRRLVAIALLVLGVAMIFMSDMVIRNTPIPAGVLPACVGLYMLIAERFGLTVFRHTELDSRLDPPSDDSFDARVIPRSYVARPNPDQSTEKPGDER